MTERPVKLPLPPWIDSELAAGQRDFAAGNLAAAASRYRRILAAMPNQSDALTNLGIVHFAQGRTDEAIRLLAKATKLEPGFAEAQLALAQIYERSGRRGEAIERYRLAVELLPAQAEPRIGYAQALARAGQYRPAAEAFAAALALRPAFAEAEPLRLRAGRPGDVEAMMGAAAAQLELGALDLARRYAEAAAALAPRLAAAQLLCGRIARVAWRLDDAIAHDRAAIAIQPDYAEAHYNLGNALLAAMRADEAAAAYRHALELRPGDGATHGNLLGCLQYRDGLTHEEWRAQLARFARIGPPPRSRKPRVMPRRKLRIGYVSPDFFAHSCAWFIAPLLAAHDRSRIEITCYAQVERPDTITARLKRLADHWLDIGGISDAALAQRIGEDGIDILIDLAGHTAGGRLGVFALRPAPIQAAWLGFPASTGLTAIDYRLSDAWLTPADTAEPWSESLWRLDRVAHAYHPPEDAPQVAEPPLRKNGFVTFGSFNNFAKISATTLDLWAAALQAVTPSRLLLKAKGTRDPGLCRHLRDALAARGVDPTAVQFLPDKPSTIDHLACYGEIDIALDTFPYNGATTTCEALWMGVPVISLVGERAAARMGLSILTQIGLSHLAVASRAEFAAQAVALAQTERLAALRAALRPRLAASPLLDARGLAHAFESAFHAMMEQAAAR